MIEIEYDVIGGRLSTGTQNNAGLLRSPAEASRKNHGGANLNSRIMSRGIGVEPVFRGMSSRYFLAEVALRWVVVTRASTWFVSSLTTVSTTFIVRPA